MASVKRSQLEKLHASQSDTTTSNFPWKLVVSLFCGVFAFYFLAVLNDFVVCDDKPVIYGNPDLNPVSWMSVVHAWQPTRNPVYQPISYTILIIVTKLAQLQSSNPSITATGALLNPHIFHLFSAIVHAANSVLVFALVRRFVKSDLASLAGAILFAVHPMQVECVAWASGADRLICVLFSIPALMLYLPGATQAVNVSNRKWRYIGSVIFGILAVLSKPTAVVLPLVALVIDRAIRKRTWKESLAAYAPWQIAVLPIIYASTLAMHSSNLTTASVAPWCRPFIAGDSLAFYIAKSILPMHLSIDYGRTPEFVMSHWWAFIAWILPVAVYGFVRLSTKAGDPIRYGYLMFVISLIPTMGFTGFTFQQTSTVADRYIYVAMPGLSVMLAALVARLTSQTKMKRIAFASLSIWFAVLGAVSLGRMLDWSDEHSLDIATLKTNPQSYIAHLNLGSEYLQLGQFDKALPHLLASRASRPSSSEPLGPLGSAYEKVGDIDSAIPYFQMLASANHNDPSPVDELGYCYMKKNDLARARQMYLDALAISPSDASALYHLGYIAIQSRDLTSSEKYFLAFIKLSPSDPLAHAYLSQTVAHNHEQARSAIEARKAIDLASTDDERSRVIDVLRL